MRSGFGNMFEKVIGYIFRVSLSASLGIIRLNNSLPIYCFITLHSQVESPLQNCLVPAPIPLLWLVRCFQYQ